MRASPEANAHVRRARVALVISWAGRSMITVQSLVRREAIPVGAEARVALDPALQGLPETAHGGSVLALFDTLAGRRGRRELIAHYRKRVPLGVPLRAIVGEASGDGVACRLLDDAGVVLVDGRVAAQAASAHRDRAAPDGGSRRPSRTPLPVAARCFVCGTTNADGLGARFEFDDDAVRATWDARPSFRARDGSLSPLALTALLDEAAFWLGALATRESGMTTELSVTLGAEPVVARTVTVVGDRRSVVGRTDDPRYQRTTVAALAEDGHTIATAAITFVAVRGAARRLARALLAINAADVVRGVFPSYVDA